MTTKEIAVTTDLNGFLHGVSLFSSMFLNNGAVAFEVELIDSHNFSTNKVVEESETEFIKSLKYWLLFGMRQRTQFHGPVNDLSGKQFEQAILETIDDVAESALDQIKTDLFAGKEFKIYSPVKVMRPIEVLQDEFLFKCNDLLLYFRCGWSD